MLGRTQNAEDPQGAAASFKRACDAKNQRGCWSLAAMYRDGRGVAQDYIKANQLLSEGCDAGDAHACYLLAGQHREGHGVAKSNSNSQRLESKACDLGGWYACVSVGLAHRLGRDVPENQAQAIRYLRKACDGSRVEGCGHLAWLYRATNREAEAAMIMERLCKDTGGRFGCKWQ